MIQLDPVSLSAGRAPASPGTLSVPNETQANLLTRPLTLRAAAPSLGLEAVGITSACVSCCVLFNSCDHSLIKVFNQTSL